MYSQKFEKAFREVINREGVYVNDPYDPGGETKYGICKRSYPNLNIKELTLEEAKKIYHCDFWKRGKFEDVPDNNVAIKLFDLSVNMGLQSATIILQRALRAVGISVVEDGVWRPKTQFGIISANPRHLLTALKAEAAGYYRLIAQKSPTQQKFLSGWLNRAYA